MNYGYARVSSKSQNLDRQIEELKMFGLSEAQLYVDCQSGKDFDRQAYRRLKEVLHPQDLLVIKSIDRLGRNYQAILEEWADLTKRLEVQIVVLDMPLLDTRSRPDNLVGCFISDLVLQILSFVAENEQGNGVCKLILAEDETIIGAHLLGNPASELIVIAGIAVEKGMKVSELKSIVFPHPTVGEILKEAL